MILSVIFFEIDIFDCIEPIWVEMAKSDLHLDWSQIECWVAPRSTQLSLRQHSKGEEKGTLD